MRRKFRFKRTLILGAVVSALFVAVIFAGYVLYLDRVVTKHFEGQRWQVPSRVYARPLELYRDKKLTTEELRFELTKLNYHSVERLVKPGQYVRQATRFIVHTRGFEFPDQVETQRQIQIDFDGQRISDVIDIATGKDLVGARLEPLEIGAIYPAKNEDRLLTQLHEIPDLLLKGLVAVEDHHFYRHRGVDLVAIARALFANIEAGEAVQGGSTLTQQLVKNFYLNNDKSLKRKFNEAIMALLLDYHYEKDEILEAYLNEVYLGQAGNLAIHGFALAAPFYFEKKLGELDTYEIALLIGLVRGPSYYDPRRFPDRALARRNLVLKVMNEHGLITKEQMQAFGARALGVTKNRENGLSGYPSYLRLVKQQLAKDYDQKALSSDGYRLFTSLDPIVQNAVEQAVDREITAIERDFKMSKDTLQVAIVVTHTASGEVVALTGGRDELYGGFNRALEAKRPIGSLVKPAVYLTALQEPERYHLATMLDDSPLVIEDKKGKVWAPKNYDNEFHDSIPLYESLAHSYNVATVRLAMEVGLDKVVATLHRLGIEKDISPLPSLPLGAIDLSPIEVAQMYQTIAGGGYQSPLRALNTVVDAKAQPLSRYNLEVKKVIDDEYVYLITTALQNVAQIGTARSVYTNLAPELAIAGKTGTTNDLRDSWFAGFAGDYLAVVWIGKDDNSPTQLTGSTGALRVWRRIMEMLQPEPLILNKPQGIEMVNVDTETGQRIAENCDNGIAMPAIASQLPPSVDGCGEGGVTRVIDWLKQFIP